MSGAGARIYGGRWNPPGISTLYLGLSRGVVLAEFARMARKEGRDIGDFLPRNFYEFDVELEAVLDLRDAASRATIGLQEADVFGEDYVITRGIGEAAHYLGLEAIVAPSVTRTGEVLAIFTDRLRSGSGVIVAAAELLTDPLSAPST